MKLDDIYDNVGQDGIDNETAFNRMPSVLRYFISSTQSMIVGKVKGNVRRKYGEEGIKDLVKTSGFRSCDTNSRNGGVADSLHLYGCAVDFAKVGIFKDNPIPTCCNLQCIDSGDCWHVQLKRG